MPPSPAPATHTFHLTDWASWPSDPEFGCGMGREGMARDGKDGTGRDGRDGKGWKEREVPEGTENIEKKLERIVRGGNGWEIKEGMGKDLKG